MQFGCVQAGTTLGHLTDAHHLVDELVSFRPTSLLTVPRMLEKVRDAARAQAGSRVRRTLFNRAETIAVDYSRAWGTPEGPTRALRWRHRVCDLLVYRRLRDRLGGRCRTAISGGAPLDPDLAHFFRGAGVTVYEAWRSYAQTQTSPRGYSQLLTTPTTR